MVRLYLRVYFDVLTKSHFDCCASQVVQYAVKVSPVPEEQGDIAMNGYVSLRT